MSNPDDESVEMHREVDWLRPSDRRILVEIRDYGGWMKPATLGLNLPYTQRHIAARCRELTEHGLLERHEDTAGYQITDLGRSFLNDELSADDLRSA